MASSTVLFPQRRRQNQRPRPAGLLGLLPIVPLLMVGVVGAQSGDSYDDTPFSAASGSWQGYSEFISIAREELGDERLKVVAHINYDELTADDALLIVHPTHALDEQSLSAFLADGGRVALLDDYGQGGTFLRKFGVHLQNPPSHPLATLRNNPDLPIAVPAVQLIDAVERGRHPIASGIERVMTNHPRVMSHPDLTPVLEIPDASNVSHALAVTGVIAQKGRLFAMSDPSVFINLMIRYPDNRKLAAGLVRYLVGPRSAGNSSSEGCLFIVANGFDESGSYGGAGSLLSHIQRALDNAKTALSHIKDEGLPSPFALALAAALLLWLLSSQIRQQLRIPRLLYPSFARAPALAGQVGPSARLHVLSAKETSPILALMELDSALREDITTRFGVSPQLTPSQLAQTVGQQGLSQAVCDELERVLHELRSFGQSLSNGKPARATEKDLKRLHQQTMRLISELESHGALR